MEGLAFFPCATTAAANTAAATTAINPPHTTCFSKHTRVSQFIKSKSLSLHKKSPKKFAVFASKDEPKLDQWDQLELKFGQLLGEDPKLTLAKIMGKKLNPDMTYLEIEKLYNKKDKFANDVEEAPFGEVEKGQQSKLQSGLNLVHPVPQKGAKFESQNKQTASEQQKPSQPAPKKMDNAKSSVPNVILRKPTVFNEDDVNENSSRLRIQPNLSLRMGSQWPEGRFSDITLLKKPEPSIVNMGSGKNQDVPGDVETKDSNGVVENNLQSVSLSTETTDGVALLEKPGLINLDISSDQEQKSFKCHDGLSIRNDVAENSFKSANTSTDAVNVAKVNRNLSQENRDFSSSAHSGQENITELQQLEQNDIGPAEKNLTNADRTSEMTALDVTAKSSIEAALQGKPKRLDQTMTVTSSMNRNQIPHANGGSYSNPLELENFLVASPIKEHEDADWSRAEDLIKRGGKVEVELLSCSTRGFVVSFGSLIGFLPYRNLSAKWKFLAFESWVRRKGLDPAKYKKKLGVIGGCQTTSDMASDDSGVNLQIDQTVEGTVSPDMKLLDLLRIYDQEKLKFLTSFVGQKVRAIVTLADRNSRRLIFSVKPKEKEELIEKKRSLMAKVSVGDVVKCCIKKITYFGIFVEVEGVPALIHQTEVSWDATLDPASYYKIGQTVEAKVHQLDFSLERIFLSLKEVTPDPLMEALEAVVGDHVSIGGRLQAAQADDEWADVESLMKELQQFDGIQSVSKGRFFLSPGLAPTFQVYLASMFENQYKLLARSGNRIQEVIVEASLGKEDMKSAILTCTNRVE